jgi:hypothetical protein
MTVHLVDFLHVYMTGFGQRVSWEDDASAKPGHHQLTFRDALHTAAGELVLNFLLPNWIKALPHPRLRKIKLATDELRVRSEIFAHSCTLMRRLMNMDSRIICVK